MPVPICGKACYSPATSAVKKANEAVSADSQKGCFTPEMISTFVAVLLAALCGYFYFATANAIATYATGAGAVVAAVTALALKYCRSKDEKADLASAAAAAASASASAAAASAEPTTTVDKPPADAKVQQKLNAAALVGLIRGDRFDAQAFVKVLFEADRKEQNAFWGNVWNLVNKPNQKPTENVVAVISAIPANLLNIDFLREAVTGAADASVIEAIIAKFPKAKNAEIDKELGKDDSKNPYKDLLSVHSKRQDPK